MALSHLIRLTLSNLWCLLEGLQLTRRPVAHGDRVVAMLTETCHKTESRPPLAQFTIALLLIKSKPSGLHIEEYIASLRLHIKQTSEPLSTTSNERHIDATSFWRDAFTKSLETQTALRIRVAELEQLNRECAKACARPVPSTPNGRETRSKRKAPTSSSNGSEKRFCKTARKTSIRSLQHKGDTKYIDTPENSDHALGTHLFVQAYLQQVYDLQDTRSLPNPSARDLANILDQALLIISQLAKHASETAAARALTPTSIKTQTSGCKFDCVYDVFAELEGTLSPQLHVMKSFLPFLLGIFDEVGHLQGGDLLQRSLTYNFTIAFKNLFECICELANMCAAFTKTPCGTAFASQIHRVHVRHALSEHPPFLLALCEFGLALVNGLDCAKAAHSNVMEGCLYTILRKIGHRLRESVFGTLEPISEDASSTTTYSPDRRSFLPDEVTKIHPPADSLYMIYILERFPSLERAFLEHTEPQDQAASQSTSHSTRDSPPAPHDSKSGKLISSTSLRFQHTLLKAVFGEKQAADFEPSLREPHKGEILQHTELQGSQEDGRNWFKREIWRLVGWEVLRSKLDAQCSKGM